jgi:propanediol utilization protein
VLVKVDSSFIWRLHLDTDEANAAGLKPGDLAEVLP